MIKVIVNADDYGISENTSIDIISLIHNKVCDTTSVMVNMLDFEKCYSIASNEGIVNSVGLHLNLSEGKPITKKMAQNLTFCNSSGEFDGRYKSNFYKRCCLNSIETALVRDEFRAQIERYLRLGYKGMHIDSHQGVHMDPSLFSSVLALSKEYEFTRIRRSPNLKCNNKKVIVRKLIHIPFDQGLRKSGIYYANYLGNAFDFSKKINSISENEVAEMMCHPKMIDGMMYLDHCSNFLLDDYREVLKKINHWR